MWLAALIALIAFSVATISVGWLARSQIRIALDKPNSRSLHTVPIPRTGGIGLLLGIGAAWAVISPQLPWTFWVAITVLITISLLDDLRGLSVVARLGAHLLAAALAATALLPVSSALPTMAIGILAIGWMCNLYNFMDGSDGLAGGMAVSGFLFFAIAAALAGSTQFALLNLAVAAAAAGFLLHNFHPARIFLGDTGAVPLGFLAAVFGITGWLHSDWTWWFPLLVFSPFIIDASVTLGRRLLSGARVWEAHRDHYYQRLVRLGLGHRGTALAGYALMTGCGVVALGAMTLTPGQQYLVLAVAAALYTAVIVQIERVWRKRGTVNA